MTDDERQKTLDFILEQQAQFSVSLGELAAAQQRTDATVGRLASQVERIAQQQAHINEVVAVMADAQQHTDERLNALIDIVSQGRNGKA